MGIRQTQDLERLFPGVMSEIKGPIRFCGPEKRRIETKEGEMAVKRGDVLPEILKKKLKKCLEVLEGRGIIRKSSSNGGIS
jgi:hypothetical protein